MPLIQSSFASPLLLRSGDLQSVIPAILRRAPELQTHTETIELEDGDILELDWLLKGNSRLAIITHGLEGSTRSSYVRGLAHTLSKNGWDVLAWNMRGCGTLPNRLPTWYHSGQSADLKRVVQLAIERHNVPMALIGFSVGGNITLKYLGEESDLLPSQVKRAVAVSVPMDLRGSANQLAKPRNRLYMEYLLRPLRRRIKEKAQRFPELFDARGLHLIKNFHEFDRLYTAPFHGFRSVDEYWDKSSALAYISKIKIPTLAISAANDPFLSESCLPYSIAREHQFLYLETPSNGGHVGFIDRYSLRKTWMEGRVSRFLSDS